MYPYLIDFGTVDLPVAGSFHLALPTYGVLVTLGILVGFLWFLRNARADGIDGRTAEVAAFWGVVCGIGGGKLGLIVVELPEFLRDPSQLVSEDFLRSAGVVWTAVLAGIAGFVLSARRNGLPVARLLDAVAVPVPLSQAIGRIGCLMAGCCHGAACDPRLPWAVIYRSKAANAQTGVPLGIPMHPAPVYEALWSVLVVLPLLLLLRRRADREPGELLLAYLALYGAGRFLVEFSRGDRVRGVWFGGTLSTSQLLSLAIVPVALGLWFWLRRRASSRADGENAA